ncbi:MAG: IS630 family transposase [Dehalococcoidia bacterium]
MSRIATQIRLSEEERQQLESWVRKATMEQRFVQRACIILESAAGKMTKEIAHSQGLRAATVSKWRTRFSREGVTGLADAARPGKAVKYDQATERRILAQLDTPPPAGYAIWTGRLVAEALGDVSAHQVWRVLRQHGVHLGRRRSWCVSTDPEFTRKAADIVALYLDPPENAVVLSVDEKPAIQALERAQGWLRLPNGHTLRGFSHEYKRHGTTTLFAALEVATGLVQTGHYRRRRRREFLDFMNRTVSCYPDQELHVILDNLNIHKPKHDRWLARHPNVHFHYTPTHASWLNQIECWFSILWRKALQGLSATSPRDVCLAIDAFTAARNEQATPFEWTKEVAHPVNFRNSYADLCK